MSSGQALLDLNLGLQNAIFLGPIGQAEWTQFGHFLRMTGAKQQ